MATQVGTLLEDIELQGMYSTFGFKSRGIEEGDDAQHPPSLQDVKMLL